MSEGSVYFKTVLWMALDEIIYVIFGKFAFLECIRMALEDIVSYLPAHLNWQLCLTKIRQLDS